MLAVASGANIPRTPRIPKTPLAPRRRGAIRWGHGGIGCHRIRSGAAAGADAPAAQQHRRMNVLLLLDDGWTAERVAEALYISAETVREHRRRYETSGISGLERLAYVGAASDLTQEQRATLATDMGSALPHPSSRPTQRQSSAFGQPPWCMRVRSDLLPAPAMRAPHGLFGHFRTDRHPPAAGGAQGAAVWVLGGCPGDAIQFRAVDESERQIAHRSGTFGPGTADTV